MIRKSGIRFSEKIMLKQKLERDADPTITHPALVTVKLGRIATSERGKTGRVRLTLLTGELRLASLESGLEGDEYA
jgi:hypothetical protein